MSRALHKLTDRECKTSKFSGMLGDGGGLYLSIKPSGSRSWCFLWKKDGKRREMGLGSYPTTTLAKARELAGECRQLVSEGRNPIEERRRKTVPTFGECAEQFIFSMETQWRNQKHRWQWRQTIRSHAASIQDKLVSEIDTDDVLAVLVPIWTTKSETASRLRGRIERVLDFAKARGWRSGENPALWRGHLKSILPSRTKLSRGHHAAMPYPDIPAFVARLHGLEAVAARALEFIILTGASRALNGQINWARCFRLDPVAEAAQRAVGDDRHADAGHSLSLSRQ